MTGQEQHHLGRFSERLAQVSPHAIVTPAIVALNVLIFVAMAVSGIDMMQPDGRRLIAWGSNFGPLTTNGQWWRLFTAMFLHAGIVHLGLNMWVLLYCGRIVERLYGSLHFLLLYMAAGLVGSIASLLWNPMINSVGASGAIFGVYGGLLAFMFNRRNQVPTNIMKEQGLSAIIFIVYSLSYGMRQEGIDNAAHLGGLVGGLAMGWLLARPLDARLRQEAGLRRLALALVVAPLVLVLFTLPVQNTGEEYRLQQQFLSDIKWFGEEEKRLVQRAEEWRLAARSERYSRAELSAQLEQELVKPWQAIHDRLVASPPLAEDSQFHAHQVLILESVTLRRDAFQLLAQGIRTDHEPSLAQAKALFEASNKTIEKLQELQQTP